MQTRNPRWDGDATHRLPFGSTEPYRLWFEFLRLALRDRAVSVDQTKYQAWGDFQTARFDDWWSANWRSLFGVERAVVEIKTKADWQRLSREADRITLSIPSDAEIRPTIKRVRDALRDAQVGLKRRRRKMASAAKYTIAAKNLKLQKLQQLHRIYGMWLDSNQDIDATAKSYSAWAKTTNANGKNVPAAGWEHYEKGDGDERRRAMRRYIRKAKRIVENVARGVFPGAYG